MEYILKSNEKEYELPPRNFDMDAKIKEMASIDFAEAKKEVSREESIQRQFDFVQMCAPGLLGGDIESVDVNDIISARFDIVEVYEKPAREKRAAAMAEEAREILYRPEIKRLLALYGLNGKR